MQGNRTLHRTLHIKRCARVHYLRRYHHSRDDVHIVSQETVQTVQIPISTSSMYFDEHK